MTVLPADPKITSTSTSTRVHSRGSLLSVDLDAVASNTCLFVERGRAAVMAVVKADGFGHGAVEVARIALSNGASSVGVTSVDEALRLRASGIRAPLLSWLNHVGADFDAAVGAEVELAVPSYDHLKLIERTAGCARLHLHLDTGMARDGAAASDWVELCRAARAAEQAAPSWWQKLWA